MTDLKQLTCRVYDCGNFLPFALMLTRHYGRVEYFTPWLDAYPTSSELDIGKGFEEQNFFKCVNFWEDIDDVDIFVFPDIGAADVQDQLVRMGKLVWGSRQCEQLEMFRAEAKELMKKMGMPVNPYEVITGIDALREYLKEVDDRYIKVSHVRGDCESFHHIRYELTEPRLNELEHHLGPKAKILEFIVEEPIKSKIEVGYDGFTIDGDFPRTNCIFGYEIKDAGYAGAILPYNALPEPVKWVNAKMAPMFRKYNYRGCWSDEIRVGEDNKFYLLDPCCFSDDTEILTDKGWKLFQNLDKTECVATLNPTTNVIEYHKPYKYISYQHEGDMVSISNPRKVIECMVTPNHRVWRTDRHGNKASFERADSLTDKGFIPRTGKWTGVMSNTFILSAYHNSWESGRNQCIRKDIDRSAKIIDMNAWLRFLAIYLAEGSCHSNWSVNISQFKHVTEMEDIIKSLSLNYTKTKVGFVIHSVQLVQHLKQFGLCDKKFVPEYVKQLPGEQIRVFLDAYILGDGSIHKGQKLYYTTSCQMADDLQELIFKAGSVSTSKVRPCKGTFINIRGGKTYYRNHDIFIIGERKSFDKFWFETKARKDRYIKSVPYSGMVHCVEVENHIIYVRRNGKPFWSGNCRCGSPPSELYAELYSNWGEIIYMGAQGIMVEPKVTGLYGVQIMIHSSWSDKNWVAVHYPEKFADNVKIRFACKIEGVTYAIPQNMEMGSIGSIVAVDTTLMGAIKKIVEIAKHVEGYSIELRMDSIAKCMDEIHLAEKKHGYRFGTGMIPSGEVVAKVVAG